MRKRTIIGLAVATAIVATAVFLHLSLLTIYYRYHTRTQKTEMGNANVISFPTHRWITLSERMPHIGAGIITAWLFKIIPTEPQYEESRQYFLSRISFEAFSDAERKWLLLSKDITPTQFQFKIPEWPDKPYYSTEIKIPAKLLSCQKIRIKLVIVIKDTTNHTETEKEVEFIHDIRITREYSNFIMDTMSSV